MTDERWKRRANHVSSRVRAVGGRLTVEGEDLVFRPHGLDRALAGKDLTVPLREITGFRTVGIAPLELFAGGLRRRLAIETAGGATHLFVVSRPEAAADELRALAGG